MRVLSFFVVLTLLWSGCSIHDERNTSTMDVLNGKERISYYDRNGDGKVDLEQHRYAETADADWALRDDNYDGRFEKKIRYGIGVFESALNVPIPTNVPVEPNR